MLKIRNMVSTSLAALFAFIAVGSAGICCPLLFYQPELPERD